MQDAAPRTRFTAHADLADIIGMDAAEALGKALDGKQIEVPASCDADHPIAKAVGTATAALITHNFRHTILVLPTTRRADRVVEMRAAKMTVREIAMAVGITDYEVRTVLGKHRLASRQQARTIWP